MRPLLKNVWRTISAKEYMSNPAIKKRAAPKNAVEKIDVKSKVAAKKWLNILGIPIGALIITIREKLNVIHKVQ